jgi:4a-hydroxytetrahydrobiopterin dehydratase
MDPILLPQIIERLKEFDEWELNETDMTLETTIEFEGFLEAVGFVADLAEVAEILNHHPVIVIDHTVVVLSVWTQNSGEDSSAMITEKDFGLMEAIDRLVV